LWCQVFPGLLVKSLPLPYQSSPAQRLDDYQFSAINASSRIRFEYRPNFVTHVSKEFNFLLFGSGRMRGIVKRPVMPV
jgi:hypothetical protein